MFFSAFYAFKTSVRNFVNVLLNRIPKDAVPVEIRARALSLAVTFPYAVVADLREQKVFEQNTVEGVLSDADLAAVQNSATLPVHVLERLTKLITEHIADKVNVPTANTLHAAVASLVGAYVECERIKQNPCMLSYVAHMRAFLVGYLVTLPLAILESMGWMVSVHILFQVNFVVLTPRRRFLW